MQLYLGLISGTSADGIDAVLMDFTDDAFKVISQHSFPYPAEIRKEVLSLAQPALHDGDHRIDRLGHLDHQIGSLFADAARQLCAMAKVDFSQLKAIGSHGQTIRHRPQCKQRFSLQIADPNVIALETGVVTIADFRRMDIAAGGEGAPLVPLFHQALFGNTEVNRVILNLGGIANITWLPQHQGAVMGFDTGPANALCDYWIEKHKGEAFDNNGEWAASGTVSHELLKHMRADPYFILPAPKSTGREYFDAQWLEQKLKGADRVCAEDVQATLVELSAITIAEQIKRLPDACDEVLVCGGGAHNDYLMARLIHHLHDQTEVKPLQNLPVDSDFIEAATFAWLAKQRLDGNKLDYRTVTGATRPVLMGNIFHAG